MYSREEWNDIYKIHMKDAPWMSKVCAEGHLAYLDRYLNDVNGKRLLDYGCGHGLIAYHYYQKGATVELADISDVLVNQLKKKYKKEGFKIHLVSTPQDIDEDKGQYDIIIANALFHHIQPELWTSFLKGFAQLLKTEGILLLSGWDDSEFIAKTHRAPFTQKPTWSISSIGKNIRCTHRFDIIAEEVHDLELDGYFINNKKFKYYVLKKKQH